jgi:hypothetical protein
VGSKGFLLAYLKSLFSDFSRKYRPVSSPLPPPPPTPIPPTPSFSYKPVFM